MSDGHNITDRSLIILSYSFAYQQKRQQTVLKDAFYNN